MMKLRICEICQEEKECKEFHLENEVFWVCRICGANFSLRRNYELKFKLGEITIRQAIIKLAKESRKREEIKFILALSEKEFTKEINRLKNLVQFRSLFKKLSEPILPKQSSGEMKKDDFKQD